MSSYKVRIHVFLSNVAWVLSFTINILNIEHVNDIKYLFITLFILDTGKQVL